MKRAVAVAVGSLSLALITNCVPEHVTAHHLLMVNSPEVGPFFRPPARDAVKAARWHGWFVPAEMMQRLAELYDHLGAFSERSPEFCSLIWLDDNTPRMVHATRAQESMP